MQEANADGGFTPDDLGPAPGQNEVGDEESEEGCETGGIPELQSGGADVDSIRQAPAGWWS